MRLTRVRPIAALLGAALATAIAPAALAAGAVAGTSAPTAAGPGAAPSRPDCSTAAPGDVRCYSGWQSAPQPVAAEPGGGSGGRLARPDGIGADDVTSAYWLGRDAGMTVAIVIAYSNPNLEKDLAVYRSTYGLPPCTTANGCLKQVNQWGGPGLPQGDPGWGVEESLDVQMVSAACPKCRILVVKAQDPSVEGMGTATRTAVRLGAKVVSHSYGLDEMGSLREVGRRYYTHPGTAQVVASGDWGFTTASFPAVLPNSIAVGGTVLEKRSWGWRETVWPFAGSACSAWFAKPAWQKDRNCLMRTVADVSAVAEDLAVYDTYGLGPDAGWLRVGGTSASAPLIAGMIARAGNPWALSTAEYIYRHPEGLRDITVGANGECGGDYLCTGKPGYDAPTGMGAPRGLKAL